MSSRCLAGVSDSLYRAASKGRIYVDVHFDLSLNRENAKLPCSDGVVREAKDAFCAFVLLGKTEDVVQLDVLTEYTINCVRERFPHLRVTVMKEGKILPTLRITFASMDTLLC